MYPLLHRAEQQAASQAPVFVKKYEAAKSAGNALEGFRIAECTQIAAAVLPPYGMDFPVI
jgi:hypothetical protein